MFHPRQSRLAHILCTTGPISNINSYPFQFLQRSRLFLIIIGLDGLKRLPQETLFHLLLLYFLISSIRLHPAFINPLLWPTWIHDGRSVILSSLP